MSTHNPGPPDQPGGSDNSPWTPPDPGPGWTPPADPNAGAEPEPGATPQVFGAGGHPIGQPRPGKMARQEPGVTQPRPPTVGEARAREHLAGQRVQLACRDTRRGGITESGVGLGDNQAGPPHGDELLGSLQLHTAEPHARSSF